MVGAPPGIGLPAQLLAVGVEQVLVLADDDTLDVWRQSLGTTVAPLGPARRGWRRPRQVVFGQTPLPRRMVLGLPVRCPLDLSCDDADRTSAALALLRARQRIPDDGPAHHPASRLVVSGCTACGVCVQACPTSALELAHDGTTSVLTHHAGRCRSNADCLRLCPAQALSAAGPVTFDQVLDDPTTVLATLTTTTCPRCGARHVGDTGSLCPLCAFRRTHVFGSMPVGHSLPHDTAAVAP